MMISILSALIALAACGLAAAVTQILKLKKQNRLGAAGYADLVITHNKALAKIAAHEAEITGLESELTKSEQARKDLLAKSSAVESGHINVKTTLERKLANAELQRDHILAKYEALQHELEEERAEAQERFDTLKKSQPAVDPRELETLRRKASQNEQLFHSMRGLRDMAEERNKNWESALRKLSTWILTSSPLAIPNDPIIGKPIGPLVGEALSRTGQSILDVTPMEDRRAEASHLASVEL